MMGVYIPTWKLIWLLFKNVALIVAPILITAWLIITLMRFIGNLP